MAALIVFSTPAPADDRPLVGEPIDEGSSSELTFMIADSTSTAVTQRDLFCWVDDRDTTQRLYGPILPTPGAPVTITLPPQANQIVTETNDLEEHIVTCIGRFPAGCVPVPTPNANCKPVVGGMRYRVRNQRVSVGGSTPQPSPAPTPTS